MTPDDSWCPLMTLDDSWWLLMTRDDSWWLLMTPDDSWCLLMTPDNSWRLLTTPDDSWWLVMTPDDSWWLLMTPDDSWWLLMTRDDSWWLVMTPDDSWWLVMTPDDSWWFLMTRDGSWWLLMTRDDFWWVLPCPDLSPKWYDAWLLLESEEVETDKTNGRGCAGSPCFQRRTRKPTRPCMHSILYPFRAIHSTKARKIAQLWYRWLSDKTLCMSIAALLSVASILNRSFGEHWAHMQVNLAIYSVHLYTFIVFRCFSVIYIYVYHSVAWTT